MKVLVIGDRIVDHYTFCTPQRLCPEAPALVLKPEQEISTEGGAALVAAQLIELLGKESVVQFYGSVSHKHRIFADRQLVCRIDRDTTHLIDQDKYLKGIIKILTGKCDAVVCGDYGKGAMPKGLAFSLVHACSEKKIPLFVDAKADPDPYKRCFAIFPNREEHNHISQSDYQHVIRKLGKDGCMVDGVRIPTEEQQVYDVTGAGDIFLGAFVTAWLTMEKKDLKSAAAYANKVAGISVRYLGTHVVTRDEQAV